MFSSAYIVNEPSLYYGLYIVNVEQQGKRGRLVSLKFSLLFCSWRSLLLA